MRTPMNRPLLLLALVLAASGCTTLPTGLEVAIEPSEPEPADRLEVRIVQEPEVDDELSYTYYWFQDGAAREDLTGGTVPSEETRHGETWMVIVVPAAGDLVGQGAPASVQVQAPVIEDPDGDGWTEAEGDCAPDDPDAYPGAPEECDGQDSDCLPESPAGDYDDDLDGVAECEGDCDDSDPLVFPGNPVVECVADPAIGATNCDAEADVGRVAWYPDCDLDGDGSSSEGLWLHLCPDTEPSEQTEFPAGTCDYNGMPTGEGGNWIDGALLPDLRTDCNDTEPRLHGRDDDQDGYSLCDGDHYPGLVSADSERFAFPGACEVCDKLDNNLDGNIDEGFDQDSDGAVYDHPADTTDCEVTYDPADVGADGKQCGEEFPVGHGNFYPLVESDCDDDDPSMNRRDEDGDGVTTCGGDCNDGDPSISDTDLDGDGYTTCMVPPDCDDTDPALFPSDEDGDGYTTCEGDCLDVVDDDPSTPDVDEAAISASVFPGNGVQCDGWLDTDCDGVTDPLEDDADADGSTECDGDCDDTNPALNGLDVDGDGWSTCQGDCDDSQSDVYPGAPNLCDGISDNDCNGVPDPNEGDVDADGSSVCDGDCNDFDATVDSADLDGDGWSSCAGDCDDAAPTVNPGVDADGDGWDVCGAGGVPADCDDTDPLLHWSDVDGDGSSTCSAAPDCDDLDASLNQLDADSDGETSCDGDCNDHSSIQRTIGVEGSSSAQADGVDNDCDGVADEGLIVAGDLAITEILVAAAPPTSDGPSEYVEVFNASSHDVDLRGWEVEVDDLGIPTTTVFTFPSGVDESPLLIAAGERVVLARSANATVYGYDIADYYWSAAAFSDLGGSLTLSFGTTDVDVVTWLSTGCMSDCDDPTSPGYAGPSWWRPGYAMGLKEADVLGADPATANDDDANWCEQRDPLVPVHGSPGAAPIVLGECG